MQQHYKNQQMHASCSEAVTNSVRVEVQSHYAPEHSQPFQCHWFFHYTVKITNEGDDTVQLLSRHWFITDATGHTEQVRGTGVVGEQPVLASGESFSYTSGCPLKTSSGVMAHLSLVLQAPTRAARPCSTTVHTSSSITRTPAIWMRS